MIATLLLVWMVNPWVDVPEALSNVVTVAFWVLAIALVVVGNAAARARVAVARRRSGDVRPWRVN